MHKNSLSLEKLNQIRNDLEKQNVPDQRKLYAIKKQIASIENEMLKAEHESEEHSVQEEIREAEKSKKAEKKKYREAKSKKGKKV